MLIPPEVPVMLLLFFRVAAAAFRLVVAVVALLHKVGAVKSG